MKKIEKIVLIPSELRGNRLDQALSTLCPEYSRSQLQNWIRAGQVRIDGEVQSKPRIKVNTDQTITVCAELLAYSDWQAQAIPLDVIYADDDLIIINKPPGLVVHPGAGQPDRTLVNALLNYDPELATLPRAGLIHRLDKDTSGLLVVARNLSAHHYLTQAMANREIQREYVAIVNGVMISGGTVDAPMGRHPLHRTKMAVNENGNPAITHYRVLQRFRAHTSIHLKLETGRTHQIRVHMSYIQYPIVGDPLYGRRLTPSGKLAEPLRQLLMSFPRQALHAQKLTLEHPTQGTLMSWEAPLPTDIQELLDQLQADAN